MGALPGGEGFEAEGGGDSAPAAGFALTAGDWTEGGGEIAPACAIARMEHTVVRTKLWPPPLLQTSAGGARFFRRSSRVQGPGAGGLDLDQADRTDTTRRAFPHLGWEVVTQSDAGTSLLTIWADSDRVAEFGSSFVGEFAEAAAQISAEHFKQRPLSLGKAGHKSRKPDDGRSGNRMFERGAALTAVRSPELVEKSIKKKTGER